MKRFELMRDGKLESLGDCEPVWQLVGCYLSRCYLPTDHCFCASTLLMKIVQEGDLQKSSTTKKRVHVILT